MHASSESGGNRLLQCSHDGLSSSIAYRPSDELDAFDDFHEPIGQQAVGVAVNGDRCFLIRRIDQAEHLSRLLVEPVGDALDVVLRLGPEVGLMGRGYGLRGQAGNVLVNVHEQWHR